MLLALWPLLFPRNNAHSGGRYVDPDVTHRAIRGKEQAKRTAAMLAAEAHLKQLREAENVSHNASGNTGGEVALASVSDSYQPVGNAPVRISRHERTLAGRIPEALGASIAASDVVSLGVDAAMRRFAAKQQADEDDDMAMIIILAGMY